MTPFFILWLLQKTPVQAIILSGKGNDGTGGAKRYESMAELYLYKMKAQQSTEICPKRY
ncbi:hypothetical protein [Priestia megaterium]|uniref:hypothetical protein n=1 Tax=Priestia megaterium TaxID=1404 RepID=UPI0023780C44|nr:hypothetical protein [Priestia megaterium]